MEYTTKWHREGKTEYIHSVAVYYVDIDEDLEGGNVEFSPQAIPQDYYVPNVQAKTQFAVSTCTGAAVVFGNELLHRASPITNLTDSNKSRLFVNFFMVDPRKQIAPKTSFNTIVRLLQMMGVPDISLLKILGHLDYPEMPGKFRMAVKHDMLAEKDSWADRNYGNSGDVTFVRDSRNYLLSIDQYIINP
jgi:hypothetical protein